MSSRATGLGRVNPITLLVDGFDWFGRSRRTAFNLVWIAFAACGLAFGTGTARPDWPGTVTVAAILGLALLFVPVLGHGMRRLNDLGWSGWWGWLLIVPVAHVVLIAILSVKHSRPAARQHDSGWRTIGWCMACLVAVMIAARTIWTPFFIVGHAMTPTLQAGELFAANTAVRTFRRGDVVVFRHPASGQTEVMRLIGLPGERLQMREGHLYIDDVAVAVTDDGVYSESYGPKGPAGAYPRCANGVVGMGAVCTKIRAIETLPGGAGFVTLDVGQRSLDNTGTFVVPADQYFVLGDNRDNANDSRVPRALGGPGFVPRDALVGRASVVILSSAGKSLLAVWTWRIDRLMKVVT